MLVKKLATLKNVFLRQISFPGFATLRLAQWARGHMEESELRAKLFLALAGVTIPVNGEAYRGLTPTDKRLSSASCKTIFSRSAEGKTVLFTSL